MTSAAARPMGDSAPSGTTFSYAQAAKGRATSTAVPTVQPSQVASGISSRPKDSNPTDTIPGTLAVTLVTDADRNGIDSSEASSKNASITLEAETKPTAPIPPKFSPSSTSVGTASTSTLPKEDDAPLKLSDTPWDRLSHPETTAEKTSEATDRKKGKKGKKDKTLDKEAEVEKEEPKPQILVAAPPPAVNFWQQRKETQAAKAKTSPQLAESPQFSAEDTNVNGSATLAGPRYTEPKKKAKPASEDAERSSGVAQNAGMKEQVSSLKTQRKASETNTRSKEDTAGKRPAPRGSRASEKEEKSAPKVLPPPVEDAMSWPTPDTAVEEKRKTLEKTEKDDKEEGSSNKPRPKEKWVPVPYIPTVTFNTPLPARGRGGRGGGGTRGGAGRGGHASNGSVSGDRSFPPNMATNATTESRERGRDNMSAGRATSLPPNASKRSVSDGAYNAQDQRKPSISTFEKIKTESATSSSKGDAHATRESRRMSVVMQTEPLSSQDRQQLLDLSKSNRSDMLNTVNSENQSQQRLPGTERRSEPSTRMSDFPKEANGQGQPRERGEGRPERGRGGYRGRGGNVNFQNGQPPAQHSFPNGHIPQSQNSFTIRQNNVPFSSTPQQQQYPATAYQNSSRGGRAGPPRSQSIPSNNSTVFSRFPPNATSATPQMPPLQTVGPVFEYPGMQTMSAMPYNPYVEQYSVLAMVTMQLEYYFSIDNLCKDVFLRKQMDSKGFVFLSVIANFKRIQSLTQEIEVLRFACQESDITDFVTGEDGIDRVRRQDGWDKWVLPMEERDEVARNDGPERYFRPMIQLRAQPILSRMMAVPHSAVSPPPFSPNGSEVNFRPYATALNGPNGIDHAMVYQIESPLSAAVPEFSPNPPLKSMSEIEAETTFTDEEVDNLRLVYNTDKTGENKQKSPFHSASSRTFSNGSIDGRLITEELLELHMRQGRSLTNGDNAGSELSPDRLKRSKSPFTLSPTKLVFGNAPPVMWVKGQKDQVPVTDSHKNESYNAVRARALRHRESSTSGDTDEDMKLLYEFWSHFLIRNFNPRMYEEFRNCAIEDARYRQNSIGMTNLVQYYDEVLNSKRKTIPEFLAKHYVDLVNAEDRSKERPGFAKLRAAWRNGALEMKSRKKIDNFVDLRLREELER